MAEAWVTRELAFIKGFAERYSDRQLSVCYEADDASQLCACICTYPDRSILVDIPGPETPDLRDEDRARLREAMDRDGLQLAKVVSSYDEAVGEVLRFFGLVLPGHRIVRDRAITLG